jgi:ABC-type phosphate/phosphonate transport system substrate-binding protein
MKNNKRIYIAAVAALTMLGFAGCGSDSSENEERSRVQTEWDNASDQDRTESCTWFENMGEEATFVLLNSQKGENSTEAEVREIIEIMKAEC